MVMTDHIRPQMGTGSDRAAIQAAIDSAWESGKNNVLIPAGVWTIDGPVYLREGLHLHLDGAVLSFTGGQDQYCLVNSGTLRPRVTYKYGTERYITVTGANGAAIKGGSGVFFYNTADARIEGLHFECGGGCGISLVYCNHIRLSSLTFSDCQWGIGVQAGTRNCFIEWICGTGRENLLLFSSEPREEIVWYNGLAVENHIARHICGEGEQGLIALRGDRCRDIILADVENKHPAAPCVLGQTGERITISMAK